MANYLTPWTGGRGLSRRGDPFLELHREMDRLFDEAWRGFGAGREAALIATPDIDIVETDDGLEVKADLPGVAEKDIDLRLDGDFLTIRGEKRNERKDERAHFVERSCGAFQRSIRLPFAPNADKVTADCANGVLTIKLPRGAEQDRSKRIEIGSGSGSQTGGKQAIGQSWSGGSLQAEGKSETAKEQAEQGQGAPA